MKKIEKSLLDSLLEVARLYWNREYTNTYHAVIGVSKMIQESCGLPWSVIECFSAAAVRSDGFNADNDTIYAALKLFGWEVVDE